MTEHTPKRRGVISRRSRAERRALVEQWEHSGQTASAFCAQHDIATATFSGWRAETRSRTAAKGFVELNLPSAPTGKEAGGPGTVPEVVVVHDHFRVELSGSSAVSFVSRVVAALTGVA